MSSCEAPAFAPSFASCLSVPADSVSRRVSTLPSASGAVVSQGDGCSGSCSVIGSAPLPAFTASR